MQKVQACYGYLLTPGASSHLLSRDLIKQRPARLRKSWPFISQYGIMACRRSKTSSSSFVVYSSLTTREHEVNKALVNSHIAKHSHARRRNTSSKQDTTSITVTEIIETQDILSKKQLTDLRLWLKEEDNAISSADDRDRAAGTRIRSAVDIAQIHNSLVSICSFPNPVTVGDRILLHYCKYTIVFRPRCQTD